jgi:hypothetical protein
MKKLQLFASRLTNLYFAIAFIVTLGILATAKASSDDFTFENDTIASVIHLYVSPHSLGSWGNDVLGLSVLAPYRSTMVYWPEEPEYDVYDIRIDFNGNHYDFTEGYNLATIDKVWITCTQAGVVTLHWR